MKNRTRKNTLQIYLSDDEQIILDSKFKQSGLQSKSSFIRNLIIYGFVYDADYSYIREYNYQLQKIGNNINQIAHKVNTNGTIYQKDMEELKEMMNQIWHIQKSMQSNQLLIKQ